MIWIFSQFENFPDVSTRLIIPNHTFLSAGAKIKLQLVVQNIFLLDFLCSHCLSFLLQKSSWSWCTIDFFEFFRFFWQTMGFKLGGYLSRAATKACLLNRTATIHPTMPFALDVQKFEKKTGFLFFFSSSWFPETSGYFLPSLPSNKSSIRRTIYPYEMLNEQWKFLFGIVKCENVWI